MKHLKRFVKSTDVKLSDPPRVIQSRVELEIFFECDFMAPEDAYGSYKPYRKVCLILGPH